MGFLTKIASVIETGAVTAASATAKATKKVAIAAKASVDAEYVKAKESALAEAKARVEAATVKASIAKTEQKLDEQLRS